VRKSLVLGQSVLGARLYASAFGAYEISINGKKAYRSATVTPIRSHPLAIAQLPQNRARRKFGALFVSFNVDGNPKKARAYFKNNSGQTIDTYDISLTDEHCRRR
jgi:hypothetical protein